MEPLTPTYAGDKLQPLHQLLVTFVRGLSDADWLRPTPASRWRVRDVVAHLVDGSIRSVSSKRDAYRPRPAENVRDYQALVAYINDSNRIWVEASERFSRPC
jgi:Mycothiol maleylpyruvate isomerase N-terminal domain